ncbi:PRC-barrel domain-containing protein [Methylomonas sp. AM2-LC]|uniref:PRC-barrel domain-containing protein n=1 Tax=Methylomonas sp. AM2-LC TaxID=3153301 RepID=UPI0032662062
MLYKAKTLKGYQLNSLDGDIGKIEEFYFDDRFWTIRYLVANAGSWLTGRQVLISPYALVAVNREREDIAIHLTQKQIEESPSLSSHKPVSKQFEEDYYQYYGWPLYWDGPYMWGYYPRIERDANKWQTPEHAEKGWDPHLRSTQAVSGYRVHALDGEIGHIDDFIIDDETWTIRYLVLATHNWWPGENVLISAEWIERISWDESTIYINLYKANIIESPEYSPEILLDRAYEVRLHRHYEREGYWDN